MHWEEVRIELLERALKRLEGEERALIELFHIEGLSIEQIAEITSLSVANVKVKLHRIRKKLAYFIHSEP